MRRIRGRRRTHEAAELNITAFMNLMVILVPFLLITAVFSRVAILQLNLPNADDAANANKKPEFHLQVTIRKDKLDIGDTRGGLIQSLPKKEGKYDYKALSKLLQKIKVRYPDKTSATILPEEKTTYDTLIQVMDSVRMFKTVQFGEAINAELFPSISIGDAPPARK